MDKSPHPVVLKSFTLKNWKSFDGETPGFLLGPVTLLIGPNNVGKSNLGRWLRWLQVVASDCTDPADYARATRIKCNLEGNPSLVWQQDMERQIEGELVFGAEGLAFPGWPLPEDPARVITTMAFRTGRFLDGIHAAFLPVGSDGEEMLVLRDGVYVAREGVNTRIVNEAIGRMFAALNGRIVFVPALRDLSSRSGSGAETGSTRLRNDVSENGGGTLPRLRRLNDGSRWNEFAHELKDVLAQSTSDAVRWAIRLNAEGVLLDRDEGKAPPLPFPLEELGSGVAEILMIFHHLWEHRDEPRLAVLEEPESHLHPGAAIALIACLREKLPKCQLLITTHSTALVDAIKSDWQVLRAEQTPSGRNQDYFAPEQPLVA